MTKQVLSCDKMLERTLRTLLGTWHETYRDGMAGDHPDIATVQAKYEVANIALHTIFEWVLDEPVDGHAILPEKWQGPTQAIHDLICAQGDEWLRARGIKPEEF